MSSSLARAGRRTHLKVVVVSLAAGIAVVAVAMTARLADKNPGGRPAWLPAPKETTLVTELNDPPSIPCRQQTWPNIDRQCLSWTATAGASSDGRAADTLMTVRVQEAPAPRKDETRVGAPAATPTSAPTPVTAATQSAGAAPAKRVKQARDTKSRLARHGRNERIARRGNDDLSDLPLNSYGAAQRRGAIRPTNPQDAYYYASPPASGSFDLFGWHRNGR
jgi:hypothetical protein